MSSYIIRRLLLSCLVLVCAMVLSFLLMRVIPGDPAMMMMGDSAKETELEVLRKSMGTDKPIIVQMGIYFRDVVNGDFGHSLRRGIPALRLFLSFLPKTIQLAGAALGITLLIAIPLGIISALRHNTVTDHAAMGLAIIGQSMPTYWMGILLIMLFAVKLHLLPTSGYGTWKHLIMPALTLGAAHTALVMRLMRSSMLEVLNQDYVRTARAKGLKENAVVVRHAIKNALIPTVTVLGLQLGNLLGGAIITETVFGWPGIGSLIVESLSFRDYPVVQVAVLLSAVIFVVVNLLVDMVYMLLDPRIAYK